MTTSTYVSQLLGSNFMSNQHLTSGINHVNYDVTKQLNGVATNQHCNNSKIYKNTNGTMMFSGFNQDFNNNQV